MNGIIPCNVEMYAVYDCGIEGEIKDRIIAFEVDDLGYISPLAFDEDMGLCEPREVENFSRYECGEVNRVAEALEKIVEKLDALERKGVIK